MTSDSYNTGPLAKSAVTRLQRDFAGGLVLPNDAGYDSVRAVYNGMIDKRPALIARCSGVADVRAALDFAQSENRVIAVRGGGHNVAGFSVCDGGVLIDLSTMKGITVDPHRKVSHSQAGLTWAEFDRDVQPYGLATTGGVVSTTGVAGFSLVGGLGWLTRKAGITVDNVKAANVLTASGDLVRADEHENAELLWGIRGAGANFGIITSFEHQLHDVGPMVYGGSLLYDPGDARKLLAAYRAHAFSAPDDLTVWLAWMFPPSSPHVPQHLVGRLCLALAGCWAGDVDRGEEMLAPYRAAARPILDNFGPRPYVDVQRQLDATAPPGLRNYWKSDYLDDLSDDMLDVVDHFVPQLKAPFSQFHIGALGGAYGRVPEDATAFRRRDARYFTQYITAWTDPADDERHIRMTREFFASMRPHVSPGVYLNFEGAEGAARVREAYGPVKYERLVALKQKYDPENVFRLNQNIVPA